MNNLYSQHTFAVYHCPISGKDWPIHHEDIIIITAKVWFVSDFNGSVADWIIKSWDKDTPLKRAETVIENNINYLNVALGNSMIPIRFQIWGSVQDIGKTDEQISGTKAEIIQK